MKIAECLLILLLFLGIFYFFWTDILNLFPYSLNLEESLPKESLDITIEKIKKEISSPPPLRATKESPEAFLTNSGIITWTNIQRSNQGLPPLSESEELNSIAAMKAKDMFENQYFAHISPAGTDVKDLAEIVGYKFIAIGENLALGNFIDDKTVVQAWMDSSGHRANILSTKYTEIGVVALQSIFEGKATWIIVQEFGLPLSVCPEPDFTLKTQIERNEIKLQELEKELAIKYKELQRMHPKWGQEYRQKADEYNTLVTQYNNLAQATQALIDKYNSQVKAFNTCVAI